MSRNSRREFLRASCASLACGGFSTLFPQLNLVSTALAASPPSGYKALVCLYLAGGNDAWNLLIPGDAAAHARYVNSRNGLYNSNSNLGGLAFPHHSGSDFVSGQTMPAALPIAGGQYALNPFAPELKSLYDQNRLALLSNIGTLVAPVTRANYNSFRPPQLYSHSDQTRLWDIGSGTSTSVTRGWGGQVAGRTAVFPSPSGSVYFDVSSRVMNGCSASSIRRSHLTLEFPSQPGSSRRAGYPLPGINASPFCA